MTRYFAFLRAINVGGQNVTMQVLKGLFEELGHTEVETLLASGNVIFESSGRGEELLVSKLEAHLQKSLGFATKIRLRSAAELAQTVRKISAQPIPAGGGLHIAFLAEPLSPVAKKKLSAFHSQTDSFTFHAREIFWLCQGKFSDSPLAGPKLEKLLEASVTVRNTNTILKLAAKYDLA